MESTQKQNVEAAETAKPQDEALAGGTYEIIRGRLKHNAKELQQRLAKLNDSRKEVFGALAFELLGTERISTDNNCVARDMLSVGDQFLFGYNVTMGLRSETNISDVFAVYQYAKRAFHKVDNTLINDNRFEEDFKNLYRYYKQTSFSHFATVGPSIFMVFRIGAGVDDVKTFKWIRKENNGLVYVDNRSDHELRLPPQHEFEWKRCTRDNQVHGEHPHMSIEDIVFVETVGGDLTVKVEDNTSSGSGIYAEPVDDLDQTLDDGEISYAIVGNLVLMKILPYKEKKYRYIVYNTKVQSACRLDSIADSCVLLPEDHGVIFSNGYYLQSGEYKEFDSDIRGMEFLKRISSPNGEDTAFVFICRNTGMYIILAYNMIEQKVATPIVCNGFTLFENGEMAYFRSNDEPQKHHQIQIWQTPFVSVDYEMPAKHESYLYKLGNKEIVRSMAACRNVLNLVAKDESYANIYVDISRESGEILDNYFWLDHADAFNIREPLQGIRETSKSAIEQFEKVVRLKKSTRDEVAKVEAKVQEVVLSIRASRFEQINDFVKILTSLRSLRGGVISLKELRYVDVSHVVAMEGQVGEHIERISQKCVEFLLTAEALEPYRNRVENLKTQIAPLEKVSEGKKLSEEVSTCSDELEMLVEIVSNLKIDDASWRTQIIDNISTIFSVLNQARAALKNRIESLASTEGKAEFASEIKLLDQAVINYLDVSDTPGKCEEYLTKVSVQLTELEGKFSDFGDFVVILTEKREEIYNTFGSRKIALVEALNKKTDALQRSAERILKGMATRLEQFETVEDINGYFAGDLMVDKVRDIIKSLADLGDSVKSGDVQSRLKTLQQDAVRQLKDRNELYVGGQDVIKFGNHAFSVNTQELALTIVDRDDHLYLHLTGTNFFERITSEEIAATHAVWKQELVSENEDVYRSEYLALVMLRQSGAEQRAEWLKMSVDDLTREVTRFMGPRYAEGYVKGVHDHDTGLLLHELLKMEASIGLLRHDTAARALAMLYWYWLPEDSFKLVLQTKLAGVGQMARFFDIGDSEAEYVSDLQNQIGLFQEGNAQLTALFPVHLQADAARYLFNVLSSGGQWHTSETCAETLKQFLAHLERRGELVAFTGPVSKLCDNPIDAFLLTRNWLTGFVNSRSEAHLREIVPEVAALCLLQLNCDEKPKGEPFFKVVHARVTAQITGMVGSSKRIDDGNYTLGYGDFMNRLARFELETVPLFFKHQELKRRLVEEATQEMRLDEFKPRVLSAFVRNRLIDQLYLPLVGENLAKQIGVVGAGTRTDRMGMLLVISPPGYGKTTLMEYIANRLGIIFMKINGPAIGNKVTSLDPVEAPNAAAREEIKKLNLALEMGDNVMLYLDDIQHCNPEFLQKFISLCDAQRKIEGVYKGKTRTYDLRGRKVCVVMAGNPYSESGEAFKIPDMLANRADTYNLGDIIGDSADVFKLSYLENCLTSNSILSSLATKNFKDVYSIINAAETGTTEGIEFEGNYSADEMSEYLSVIKKLMRIRDVILAVNQEYILSAAQSDEYRTEPPFKLQGSYRNMNRLAEKVLPIMNDDELETLVHSHYESEAQTLTTGAEANLLKFKEMLNILSPKEDSRWKEIKKTFNRNQMMTSAGDDRMGQVLMQLDAFKDGLLGINSTLALGVDQLKQTAMAGVAQVAARQAHLSSPVSYHPPPPVSSRPSRPASPPAPTSQSHPVHHQVPPQTPHHPSGSAAAPSTGQPAVRTVIPKLVKKD
ncbi:MAG: DNA repair ATPase [Deltaproteobacteria bacterium]|nr:DNA repair ATPase [Deltaproteobacteria bacterium]